MFLVVLFINVHHGIPPLSAWRRVFSPPPLLFRARGKVGIPSLRIDYKHIWRITTATATPFLVFVFCVVSHRSGVLKTHLVFSPCIFPTDVVHSRIWGGHVDVTNCSYCYNIKKKFSLLAAEIATFGNPPLFVMSLQLLEVSRKRWVVNDQMTEASSK